MPTRPVDEPSTDASADSGDWYRRENLVRFIQFGLVGGLGIVVNWGVFELGLLALAGAGNELAYTVAVSLGIIVSIFTNFVFNDIWTWGDRSKGGGVAGWFRRMVKYYVAAGVAGVVQLVVFWASLSWVWSPLDPHVPAGWKVPVIGLELPQIALAPRLSLLTGIGAGMAINFIGGHLWAFRDDSEG